MDKTNNNIDGVKIITKKVISDDRGKFYICLKMMTVNIKNLEKYIFHMFFQKKIKAWHIHKKMTLNYVAAFGKIKLVLYDDRNKSPTFGMTQEIFLSNENHRLVIIPPLIWNGFTSADDNLAILANCSDIPHDKSEILRLNFNDPKFPYDWNKK